MATPYQLALDEEWDELTKLYKEQGSFSLSLPQTPVGDTAFHLAVLSKSKEPLQSFLDYVRTDPMTQTIYWAKNIYGNTALHEAAAVGNIEAVKLLVEHDYELLVDRNKEGETPLFKAAAYGQTEVVLHLAGENCRALEDDIHRHRIKPEAGKPEASILQAAIQGEHFETALKLLELDESLATLEDGTGGTSLQLLATMPSAFRSGYRMSIWKRLLYFCPLIDAKRRIGLPILRRILKDKRKHKDAFELTQKLIDRDTTWQQISEKIISEFFASLRNIEATHPGEFEYSKPISEPIALFLATERGIVEIVNHILVKWPQMAEYIDAKNRNMLHIAIMSRKKEIFDLLKAMTIPMKRLVRGIDEFGYTILHHAADMRNDYADIHRGPAYHLQEELKWYKRVEKLAPTHYAMFRVAGKDDDKEKKNYNCKELFDLKHDELLKEAQRWVKETSQSCFAVAVLATTVLFTAVYNVPGGSNDKGYPVFLNDNLFLFFTIMVIVAFVCSLTSVVMFLLVFTSPIAYEEFLHRLLRKLAIGFTLLFVSLTTTMLAFVAAFLLVFRFQKPLWTTTLIYTAAFFPVSIFALTQFPMYFTFKVTLFKFYKWIKKVLPRK